MPKVSVIMPSLNMEKYIRKCIESVMEQTLQNIEILCIDAGSTDKTTEILQEYASTDSRIRVIHSDKKSYGYQVNQGIAMASGEYLTIVDTDDYIVPYMYEKLYSIATETVADYVKGTAELFYTLTEKEKYWISALPFPRGTYGEEERIEICPNKMPKLLTMDNFLWYGIYRCDLLKAIRLHESPGAAYQDLGGLLQTQINAEKAIYIPDPVYKYRQDNAKASIYNRKGFHFVVNEYAWAESLLQGQSAEWYTSFYRKLFFHFMDRLYVMATSQEFWEEALFDMNKIAEKLKYANTHKMLTERDFSENQWQDLQMFWNEPHYLYNKYRDIYENNKVSLKNVFYCIDSEQQIVIFGSGESGKFIHAQLLYREYRNVKVYCDNNRNVWGSIQLGIRIISPEEAVKKFPRAKYIVANKRNSTEMQRQLQLMGIKAHNIIIYSAGVDVRLFGERIY